MSALTQKEAQAFISRRVVNGHAWKTSGEYWGPAYHLGILELRTFCVGGFVLWTWWRRVTQVWGRSWEEVISGYDEKVLEQEAAKKAEFSRANGIREKFDLVGIT